MPKQISKSIGVLLIDEEVEAWLALQAYAIQQQWVLPTKHDAKTVGARRMLREVLRLAAKHLATEIGPDIAEKLARPPETFKQQWSSASKKSKPVAKSRGRKPAKKRVPKPTHRIAWNRPWSPRTGEVR